MNGNHIRGLSLKMGNVIIIGNMKAILKFDLPDEAEEHLNAINGTMYKMCLSDIDTW